eukprot:5186829-Pleurochrysis_carterae.AAC.1
MYKVGRSDSPYMGDRTVNRSDRKGRAVKIGASHERCLAKVIVVSIYQFIQYRIAKRQSGHAIRTLAMAERGGVPVCRLAMG